MRSAQNAAPRKTLLCAKCCFAQNAALRKTLLRAKCCCLAQNAALRENRKNPRGASVILSKKSSRFSVAFCALMGPSLTIKLPHYNNAGVFTYQTIILHEVIFPNRSHIRRSLSLRRYTSWRGHRQIRFRLCFRRLQCSTFRRYRTLRTLP